MGKSQRPSRNIAARADATRTGCVLSSEPKKQNETQTEKSDHIPTGMGAQKTRNFPFSVVFNKSWNKQKIDKWVSLLS